MDFSRLLTRLNQTPRYGWLADTPSTVLAQKLRDQDRAFANFFAGRAKYPKFRKPRFARAIRFQLDPRMVHRTFDANDRRLILTGLGALKLKWSRRLPNSMGGCGWRQANSAASNRKRSGTPSCSVGMDRSAAATPRRPPRFESSARSGSLHQNDRRDGQAALAKVEHEPGVVWSLRESRYGFNGATPAEWSPCVRLGKACQENPGLSYLG